VFEFKRAAYDNLARRYQDEEVKAVFAQASLLDPRFKDFGFVKDAVARQEKRKFAEKDVIKVSCVQMTTFLKYFKHLQSTPLYNAYAMIKLHEFQ